jgi:hypothetical protein
MSKFEPLKHPLATFNEIVEVNGKEVEVVNCWGFAAMIMDTICDPLAPLTRPDGLKNAIELAKHAIQISSPEVNFDKLLEQCKKNNEGELRRAMSLIANGLQEKVEEAFSPNN